MSKQVKKEKSIEEGGVPMVGAIPPDMPKTNNVVIGETADVPSVTTTASTEPSTSVIPVPEFSSPQATIPVEVKIEPVPEIPKVEVNKKILYGMLLSLGYGAVNNYTRGAITRVVGELFDIVDDKEITVKWEEIKNYEG
jgi:hypothetical protein